MIPEPDPHPDLERQAPVALPRGGALRIYPDRLRHNAEVIGSAYGPQVIAVIKGDGYGLGLLTCASALASVGIRVMAVASITEAALLRAAGLTVRLIVLDPGGLGSAGSDPDVEWLVGQTEIGHLLAHRLTGHPVHVHLDVDFGVGRGAVPADRADQTLSALLQHQTIKVVGLAGHLPASPSRATVRGALATLAWLRRRCPEAIAHLGGSDVLRWHHPTPAAWVRIGRPFYGILPRALNPTEAAGVTPAWAWQAGATAYRPTQSVGYQATSPPPGTPVRLAVGYADGLPPQAARHWPVLIDGHPYTIHEVFMLSSIAYPVCGETLPGAPATALLSGRCDRYWLPPRQIAESLQVATTAVLTYPRSPREVARA